MLARLSRWCFDRKWIVIGLWIGLLVALGSVSSAVGGSFNGGRDLPASDSAEGFKTFEKYFPALGGGLNGSIVFTSADGIDSPAVRAPMEKFFAKVEAMDHVSLSTPYSGIGAATQVSVDKKVAFASVNLDATITGSKGGPIGKAIADIAPKVKGLQVEVGGQYLAKFQPPESELIGIAFAIVVLILAFGSVLAMGLPIAVALAGVGAGSFTILLVSNLTQMPDFSTTIGAMIGLGVGIDYALFIVSRYREGLKAGFEPREACSIAMDTAGRAVLFAGLTVVVSLLGMLLIGLSFVSGLAIGASITVALTMLASVTLLPALLGLALGRVEVTRWRGLIAAGLVAIGILGAGLKIQPMLVAMPLAVVVLIAGFFVAPLKQRVPERKQKPLDQTLQYRWSQVVLHHPWIAIVVGVVILGTLAAPLAGLRMGFSDEGNFGKDTTTRRAYDLLSDGFGPGFNGPLLVTAVSDKPGAADDAAALGAAISKADGVASVTPPIPNDMANPGAATAFMIRVIPTTSPQDVKTEELVNRLRADVIPKAVKGTGLTSHVAGIVAVSVDFTNYLSERMPLFFGAVLAVSFLLLMAVFRSLLVPLKAVIMNVISIAAAYGVIVAIFGWGWFGSVLGIEPAPIEPFVPMMMFAIVFGLSMDYEVFLLSRIKEEYERHGEPRKSVADGLAATAQVITAAAAIMVVVFGSFMFEDSRVTRLFGMGLATAVLLDATLVRMLLVPATMELLGERNWWLPGWLDRILPRLDIEGHSIEPGVATPDSADASNG